MEEKKPQRSNQGKKYSTVFGLVMHGLFMISLLSLLAWFVLMIWFMVKAYVQNSTLVSHEINLFVEKYTQYVYLHQNGLLNKFITVLLEIKYITQQIVVLIFSWLNQIFKSIHHSSILINQQTSGVIATLLFGVIEIVVLRLLIFMLNLPLLVSLLFLSVVDGLGQRDIRKHSGSRESTFFFHRVKPMIAKIFFISFLIYMSIPLAVNPTIILIPMTIILSINTMLSVKSYKKYV